jgi:hypothetical protein
MEKPVPYPTTGYPFVTSDEAYQFRQPNTAYASPNTPAFELPDGLVSDGSQPRHWGDTPVSHEDNAEVNRHNTKKAGLPTWRKAT